MVRFTDVRPAARWLDLLVGLGTLIVILASASLFIRGLIPTIGFLLLMGSGLAGLFLAFDRVKQRLSTSVEIIPGKTPMERFGRSKREPREFREGITQRILLLIAFLLPLLAMLPGFVNAVRSRDPGAFVRGLPATIPFLLVLAGFCVMLKRIRIRGDQIEVIHPLLGPWLTRRFRFGDIDSVDVRKHRRDQTVIQIRLQTGQTISYMTWNDATADELLDELKRGVAEAKPATPAWDELA